MGVLLCLQVFFLIDFCYFVNLATVVYLLWFPNDARVEALVYALADGPVAGALVAWQCPWLFGSAEHTVRCVYCSLNTPVAVAASAQQLANSTSCAGVCNPSAIQA